MKNPKCIANYNKYTGGVECTNQLLQPYEIARESLKFLKCFLDLRKMVAKSISCNFNVMSLLSLFSVETTTTTFKFQERKML